VTNGLEHEAATRPLEIALWSVDSVDWKIQSGASDDPEGSLAAAVTARATAGVGQPNPLVLLHDGGGWRGATVAALPGIIDAYREAGYRFVRLDEPLRSGPARS
jgi:peptidoglycan/xylan/chitin deacetylase (PgdA/CDA1 family)